MVIQLQGGFFWLPKILSTSYQILVDSDDVTSNVMSLECSLIATNGIGEFTLDLENSDGSYNGKYTGGNIVSVYIDYSDHSNLIFKGIVEEAKKKLGTTGNRLELKGGHVSSELLGILVTKSYTNRQISDIITNTTDGLASFFPSNYTFTNVQSNTDTITISWENKSIWECIIDLCNIATADAYVDNTYDLHFFPSESVMNEEEAILETDTLINQDGLSDTIQDVKNRIVVEGAEIDGMKLIYTKNDGTSQTSYKIRTKLIQDDSIITLTQAQERAENELSLLKNPTVEGKAECFGLPKLLPGDLIYVSIPTQNVLALYKASKITHRIGAEVDVFFGTSVYLDKEPTALHHLMRDRVVKENQIKKSGNVNQMSYSYILPFDSSTEGVTFNSTEITGGKLRLTSGSSTGNMTSATHTAAGTITEIEVKANVSDDILIGTTCTVEVSCDNGISWTTISGVGLNGNSGTKYDIDSSKQGTKLLIKATLTSTATYANPEINSFGIYYNIA